MNTFHISLLLSLFSIIISGQDCNNFYVKTSSTLPGNNRIYLSNYGSPNTLTLDSIILPNPSHGLAIGPSFGFSAPNPTFWTLSGGVTSPATLWYYDGNTFVNSNHSNGGQNGLGLTNFGGSKNFLYSYDGQSVFVYSGVGNATILTTVTQPFGMADIVGDDSDNFYLLNLSSPYILGAYSPAGVLTSTYTLSAATSTIGGGAGFAITGNSISAINPYNEYFTGTISGSSVTLANVAFPNLFFDDFASCPTHFDFNPFITGIDKTKIEEGVTFFQNPVSDFLRFEFNSDKTRNHRLIIYTIRNNLGLEIKKGSLELKERMNEIKIGELSAGIYYLKIEADNRPMVTKSFIKVE